MNNKAEDTKKKIDDIVASLASIKENVSNSVLAMHGSDRYGLSLLRFFHILDIIAVALNDPEKQGLVIDLAQALEYWLNPDKNPGLDDLWRNREYMLDALNEILERILDENWVGAWSELTQDVGQGISDIATGGLKSLRTVLEHVTTYYYKKALKVETVPPFVVTGWLGRSEFVLNFKFIFTVPVAALFNVHEYSRVAHGVGYFL